MGPTAPPRVLDRGWRERHIKWQATGLIPAGRTALLYEDMTPVLDRRGRPRVWSEHVAVATQPGLRSARMIERDRMKAAEAARIAAEAAKLRGMVQRGMKPTRGRLWSLHPDALMIVGPSGGVPIPAAAVPVLEPLAAGGRHVLQERGRAALDALAARLSLIGLRIDRRREGVRIAKLKPDTARAAAKRGG